MFTGKKNRIVVLLVALVTLGIAASQPPDGSHENLKVLPKNITHETLDSIMNTYNTALGVKCGFCHAPQKDNPQRMDYASDDKPEKEITRNMMRMTIDINKKYFKFKKDDPGVPPVTCVTCHHGEAFPEAK